MRRLRVSEAIANFYAGSKNGMAMAIRRGGHKLINHRKVSYFIQKVLNCYSIKLSVQDYVHFVSSLLNRDGIQ